MDTTTMPKYDISRISVSPEELIWLYQNADSAIKKQIKDRLSDEGISVSRELIHKELCTLKTQYHGAIIAKARELIFDVKKIVFS